MTPSDSGPPTPPGDDRATARFEERVVAEELRVTAEDLRSVAEGKREAAESRRENGETTREEAESMRAVAESLRRAAETTRVAAEELRRVAEQTRETQKQMKDVLEAVVRALYSALGYTRRSTHLGGSAATAIGGRRRKCSPRGTYEPRLRARSTSAANTSVQCAISRRGTALLQVTEPPIMRSSFACNLPKQA